MSRKKNPVRSHRYFNLSYLTWMWIDIFKTHSSDKIAIQLEIRKYVIWARYIETSTNYAILLDFNFDYIPKKLLTA